VLVVFEAKAGASAARELTYAAGSISGLTAAERAELRAEARETLKVLQEDAQSTGKPVTQTIEDIEKQIIQSERGGQIRRDIERGAPAVGETGVTASVGGKETTVVLSPTKTTFVGVLPTGIRAGTLEGQAKQEGVMFRVLRIDVTSSDLESLASDLRKELSSTK
jgi:hypothetical protein